MMAAFGRFKGTEGAMSPLNKFDRGPSVTRLCDPANKFEYAAGGPIHSPQHTRHAEPCPLKSR